MPDYSSSATSSSEYCNLLIFSLAGRIAAIPIESVKRIVPMAELAQPPGMPVVLAGVLNLAGLAVPAVRLDRLFKLPIQQEGLYSMLVIVRDCQQRLIALLVDRVSQILAVSKTAMLPINGDDCFQACSEATVVVKDDIVCVLSPTRILLEKERQAICEFQVVAQQRLRDLEVSQA